MHSFKDKAGREWRIELDMATKIALRRDLGVDLYKLREDGFAGLSKFLEDDELVLRVLWHLIGSQAPTVPNAETEFYRAMTGRELDAAADQLVEELCDFFSESTGTALRKLMEAGRKVIAQGTAALNQLTADQIAEAVIARTLAKDGMPLTTSGTPGSVPASPDAPALPTSAGSPTGS